jgi:hypothetical protein
MPRDYAAEYARRIQLARERGLSTPQARGHARSGETAVSRLKEQFGLTSRTDATQRKVAAALREYERQPAGKKSLTRAAKAHGISPATVKKHAIAAGRIQPVYHYKDGKPSSVKGFQTYSAGSFPVLTPDGTVHLYHEFDDHNLSILGRYWNTVDTAKRDGVGVFLADFKGTVIRDIEGNEYHLMTDLDAIYAWDRSLSIQDQLDFDRAFYSGKKVRGAA